MAAVGWVAGGALNAFSDSKNNRWVFIGSKNQNGSTSQLYACKVASSGSLTVTAGFSSSNPCDIIVAEYSGFTFQGGNCGVTNGAQGTSSVGVPAFASPSGDLVISIVYDRSHTSSIAYSGGTGTFTVRATTANPNVEALSLADLISPGGVIGGQTATVTPGTSSGLALTCYDISTLISASSLEAPGPLRNPQGQIVRIPKITGGAPPVPVAQNLAGATIGVAYSETISVQSGAGPYTFSVSVGSLPPGLSLNTTTGVISGTPTATPATYNFTIQVVDSNGNIGSQAFQIIATLPTGGGAFAFLA